MPSGAEREPQGSQLRGRPNALSQVGDGGENDALDGRIVARPGEAFGFLDSRT